MCYAEDYYWGMEDDFEEYKVTCRYCGKGNLRWVQDEDTNHWILMELTARMEEIKHTCNIKGIKQIQRQLYPEVLDWEEFKNGS